MVIVSTMKHGALYFNFVCSFVLPSYIQQGQFLPFIFHQYFTFQGFFVCGYLFVNFSKLLQVVFKKGNLLFLGDIPSAVIWLHPCTLSAQQWRRVCTNIVDNHRYQASPKVRLTFLTRMVRSWTKSLRRLCRVWSSRAFNINREATCCGLGVPQYI